MNHSRIDDRLGSIAAAAAGREARTVSSWLIPQLEDQSVRDSWSQLPIVSDRPVVDGFMNEASATTVMSVVSGCCIFVLYNLFPALALLVAYLYWKRHCTNKLLLGSGLPTRFWTPRFVNYLATVDEKEALDQEEEARKETQRQTKGATQKMPSSTITNILPRMKRLKGPYDMYGTVYGVSTAVVHVAHPVPAAAILSSITNSNNSGSNKDSKTSSSAKTNTSSNSSSRFSGTGVSKAPAYNHFKNFCGNGVFTSDQDEWRAKRAAVMHALFRGTGSWEAQVAKEACQTAAHIARDIDSTLLQQQQNSTDSTQTINIVPVLQRGTIGLIYRYITHTELDSAERVSDDKMSKNETGVFESAESSMSLLRLYLQSVTRIRMIILAQSRSIWFLLPRWCYRWLAPMYREEEVTLQPIRQFSARACAAALPGSPLAMLQEMPLYRDGYSATTTGKTAKITGKASEKTKVSDKEKQFSKDLLDETVTLLFAGQDTSAATLSWILHLLSLYPAIQERLAQEVLSVLADEKENETDEFCDSKDGKPIRVVNKKTISKMPFLDAVIKESMRLYPVAPFVVRRLTSPVTIKAEKQTNHEGSDETKEPGPTTDTVLPEGAVACIWIYGLHRNPDFWSRPDDFIPDRWLVIDNNNDSNTDNKNNNVVARDKGITAGAYMPFALGPRNCVGQPLAHIMLRCLLCELIRRYHFADPRLADEAADPKPLLKDMQAGFTVLPQNGVKLVITPRKND